MITHRPAPELLMDHASGALPAGLSLAIAAHAALCPETAAEIARFEQLGGALLERIQPASLDDGALAEVMVRLGTLEAKPARAPAVTDETRALLPPPLWRRVKGDVRNLAWRRRSGGVETVEIAADGDRSSVILLRVAARHRVPKHTHRGLEMALVLAGGYQDGDLHFARGDLHVSDGAIDHQPIADAGEDCLCLVALSGPIRFTGPLSRLANPFVKL